MNFSIQPILENEIVLLQPLQEKDFEKLYQVASDPLVWEQHPNKNRYEREVFRNYFDGALQSKGAFLIIDKKSGKVSGSSRFYDYSETENSILIGYTFYGREFWGTGFNAFTKKLMLDYIFQYVEVVKFHVGAENWRSRKAMEKLGAELRCEIEVAYHGEPIKKNVEFCILKNNWK